MKMNAGKYPEFPRIVPCDAEDELLNTRYAKRREMQEIIPNLFLGPYAVAKKNQLEHLQRIGITHIVCVRSPAEAKIVKPNFPEQMQYFVVEISDKNSQNIIQYFPQVKRFIDGCLQSSGKVLVHGMVGFSRSAALVIAYLMETYQLSYTDSLRYVSERRPCCWPNIGFQHQLEEYEYIITARRQVSDLRKETLFGGQTMVGSKRKFEEVT